MLRFPAAAMILVASFAGVRADAQGFTRAAADVALDTVRFAPTLAVNLAAGTRLSPGLFYRDLTTGKGVAAKRGDELTVRFTAWLPSGESVAATADTTQPFTFRLGSGVVVAGWEEGLAGMQVGARRQLVVVPALAYGARRAGPIPANSVLVFEVELLGVR